MVSADSSVSVIDQVIQFTALFAIWFPDLRYKRLIRPLVFRARLIQLAADGPAQVNYQSAKGIWAKIEKMHNFTSWASKQIMLCPGLWVFTDSIKSSRQCCVGKVMWIHHLVWLHVTSGQCSIPHEANFAWEALPRGPRLLPSCVASMEIPGPCLNIKTIFLRYGDSHVKDKTVARPSYL